MKLLCIDIGNTKIKFGMFRDDSLTLRHINVNEDLDFRNIFSDLGFDGSVQGCIISSVVDELTSKLCRAVEEGVGCSPIVLDHTTDTGLKIKLQRPELLGPDRIANAVGGYELFRDNVVVVDFGTATTTTVVTGDAEIIGGHIMPGVETMLRSLALMTSRLPELKPERPRMSFGNDTKSSIMSGVIYGTAGAVERFVSEIQSSIGKCNVVITGGLSAIVKEFFDFSYRFEPDLNMNGLKKILKRSLR